MVSFLVVGGGLPLNLTTKYGLDLYTFVVVQFHHQGTRHLFKYGMNNLRELIYMPNFARGVEFASFPSVCK